jgi:ribose transport system permease protein
MSDRAAAPRPALSGVARVFTSIRQSQMLVALLIAVVLFLIGGLFTRNFFALTNIGNILALTTILGLAGAGQTLVVVSGGGIDLSVGAVMSFGAIITVQTMNSLNANILPAILIVLLMGVLVGAFNAVGVIWTQVPAMVMTMATASVVVAVQWIYCNGFPTGHPAPAITYLGAGREIPFLPWIVVVGILTVLLIQLLLNRTVYGRQMLAAGNNASAAFLSGVRVKLVQGLAFVIAGVLNAVAGFWFAAYNTYVAVGSCNIYVMPSIAAIVIGGTSLAGGKGSYLGTMVGALVLTLLNNLLVLLQTDEAGRQVVNGIVLIVLLAAYNREPRIRQ